MKLHSCTANIHFNRKCLRSNLIPNYAQKSCIWLSNYILNSYTKGTGSFPELKRPGRGVDHPFSSSAEVKERVELYLYSLSGPSWPVIGWHLCLYPVALTETDRAIAPPCPDSDGRLYWLYWEATGFISKADCYCLLTSLATCLMCRLAATNYVSGF
jgi:hypothetical protein